MSNECHLKEEFKLITYKRGKKAVKNNNPSYSHRANLSSDSGIDKETVLRRIEDARLEIQASDLFSSISASIREGLVQLENPTIKEIICFGLGKIGECMISRYQLGLLLCLKEAYNVTSIKIYDPIFSEIDCSILQSFHCDVLTENFEGKYKVNDKCTTIFYMPHCPKQLTNNVLWANWENTPKRLLNKNAEYILSIIPHSVELAVINTFRYYEIFNDTAIHIFPWNKLKLLSDDFWSFSSEPNYSDDDIEFISSQKIESSS